MSGQLWILTFLWNELVKILQQRIKVQLNIPITKRTPLWQWCRGGEQEREWPSFG